MVRVTELPFDLPAPQVPPFGEIPPFVAVNVIDGWAYVSGHGPFDGALQLVSGKVGSEVSKANAVEAARLCGLSILSSLALELGDLDAICSWVRISGFVNSAPGFTCQSAVINGVSDLVMGVWGNAGRHARTAVGVSELPFDIPVEVEAIVRLA